VSSAGEFIKGEADMKARGIIVGAGLAVAVSLAAPANAITPFNVPGTDLWDHPFGSVFDTRSGLDLEANGIAFNQGLNHGGRIQDALAVLVPADIHTTYVIPGPHDHAAIFQ